MTTQNDVVVPEKIRPILIKQSDVLKMCGIRSHNTLNKRIQQSGFPEPLKIDGIKFWVHTEVLEWLDERIEEARKEKKALINSLSN